MPELVALQTMLPQIDSPVAAQTKVLQMRQLQNANDQADFQRQQQQQAMADDQATRAAYAANPTDGSARLSALASVSPRAYAAEAKQQSDLAKAGADTRAKQLEAANKGLDLAGQAFGYVRQNPTVQNANDAIDWLLQQGVYTPEHAAQDKAKVAAAPDKVGELADMAFRASLAAKDQLAKVSTHDAGGTVATVGTDPVTGKTTTLSSLAKTQSPDNIATNERIAAEGAANRKNQIKVTQMVSDRSDGSDDGTGLSAATKTRIAQQAVDAGDYSGLKNVGRGKQGAADLRGIQNAITDYAASKGLTPTEISAKLAEFEGMKSGMRVSAGISAKIENAAAEADQLAPLAIDAGRKVARSGFLPFGKVQMLFDTNTNDPDMNRFATANIGLATAYAGAMARGGKATVTDQQHARDLLSTAKSQEAYEAIVGQMQQEIKAAKAAPRQVRNNLRNEIAGKGEGAAPAAAAIPSGWSVEVH